MSTKTWIVRFGLFTHGDIYWQYSCAIHVSGVHVERYAATLTGRLSDSDIYIRLMRS